MAIDSPTGGTEGTGRTRRRAAARTRKKKMARSRAEAGSLPAPPEAAASSAAENQKDGGLNGPQAAQKQKPRRPAKVGKKRPKSKRAATPAEARPTETSRAEEVGHSGLGEAEPARPGEPAAAPSKAIKPGTSGEAGKKKRGPGRRARRKIGPAKPSIRDLAEDESPAAESPPSPPGRTPTDGDRHTPPAREASPPPSSPSESEASAKGPAKKTKPARPARRKRGSARSPAAQQAVAAAKDTAAPGSAQAAKPNDRAKPTPPPSRAPSKPVGPEPASAREKKPEASRRREMIINVGGGDECRIAVLEDGRLEELYIERRSAESHVGSIYKGRITNVEPSIQAAFIDFGHARNGFLHISDVHPQYFPNHKDVSEDVGKKIPRRDRPLIQRCFRRGREVVVQVIKEGVGTKGPTLTTYLSIPGRFLVMMPGMSRVGVSRKIEDQADRRAMREALSQLPLPEGMGFILRTAGMGQSKRELQRDLNYLNRLWKIITDRTGKLRAPAELYQESDLVIRTIRDVLTSDFARIVVDDQRTADKAEEFLRIALPRTQNLVEVHGSPQPIFHKYGIEEEIERINARHVPLPLGGSIVIDPTEAMVAIDVNSGRFRDVDDAEKSAYQINLQAAEEIARQLRLRDLGGLIVCDFIDMRLERHKRDVERTLRNALKKHKERARILRMSQFGLIEMTRQRQRPSIKRSIYAECPHCRGSGLVKTTESMVLEIMRMLQLAAHQPGVKRVTVTVCPEAAFVVQNQKRARLHELEVETQTVLTIRGDPHYAVDQLGCECEDERGRPVKPPS